MNDRKQSSTTFPVQFFMNSSTDHISGATGLTPTVTLSKNGGSFGAAAGAVSEVGNGWYSLAGNATDRNTLGELIVHSSSAGADPADRRIVIVPWDPFDANLSLTNLDANVASRATPTQVSAAALDVLASDHNTALTIGAKINASGAAADPLATAVPGSYGAGTAGFDIAAAASGSGGVKVPNYQGQVTDSNPGRTTFAVTGLPSVDPGLATLTLTFQTGPNAKVGITVSSYTPPASGSAAGSITLTSAMPTKPLYGDLFRVA